MSINAVTTLELKLQNTTHNFFFMIRKRLISLEQQNTQNKHTAISKTKTMLVYISNFIIHTHDTNNKMVGKYYGKAIIVKIMS